jgi:hypothetical protein
MEQAIKFKYLRTALDSSSRSVDNIINQTNRPAGYQDALTVPCRTI